MTLAEEVGKGRLAGLVALRDVLAAEIEAGPPADAKVSQTAALAARLIDVLRQIEELEKAGRKGSRVDELADRRTARRAKATGAGAPGAGGVKRRRGSG